MRLKLRLQCPPKSQLSFNHHHALRAVIYRIIERADAEYSDWLHNQGYVVEGKKSFKLFSFDLLRGLPYRFDKNRGVLIFESGVVEWTLSFHIDEQLSKFVEGLFQHQTFDVAAFGTKVRFEVQSVEILTQPPFSETMRFRAESGICIAEKNDGDTQEQYRSPNDAQYNLLFFNSLAAKVRAATGKDMALPIESSGRYGDTSLNLKILTPPKVWATREPQKGSDKQIKIIGYKYDFELTAPVEWLKIGYACGFGKLASGGFGFVSVLT